MSSSVLTFLGYDDIDQFKAEHEDIAELFVNKPGYVYKFDNFSWIDYLLHSGVAKKSAIVATKGGKEVESSIEIEEVHLINGDGDEDILYAINLINDFFGNHSANTNFEPSSIQMDMKQPITISEPEEAPKEEIQESIPSLNITEEELPKIEENEQTIAPIEYSENENIEQEEAEIAPISIASIEMDEKDSQEPEKTEEEEEKEDYKLAVDLGAYAPKKSDEADEEKESIYNINNARENLGLTENSMLGLIESFIKESDLYIENIDKLLSENNYKSAKNKVSQLKSICLILRMEDEAIVLEDLRNKIDKEDKEEISKVKEDYKKGIQRLQNKLF